MQASRWAAVRSLDADGKCFVFPTTSPSQFDPQALREAGAEVVGVAVIVERGAAPKIEQAGLPYLAAYQLADLGL